MSEEKMEKLKKLADKIAKDLCLNGIEKEMFLALISQEINMPATEISKTAIDALNNLKEKSKVRIAYNKFQKSRAGIISWRSQKNLDRD